MKNKIKFNINEVEPLEGSNEDVEDALEVISDDDAEAFYNTEEYNTLREAMEDTDFRLFLIGNDLVIPGTLDNNEIKFLDIVDDEFVLKDAPQSLAELLKFKTLYNTENSEVISADDEVEEAPHDKIVEYILSLKLDDKDTDDVEDDEQEIKEKENKEDKEEETNETDE